MRARDNSALAVSRRCRALPMHPHVFVEMVLKPRIIVVDIAGANPARIRHTCKSGLNSLAHDIAVLGGERLTILHLRDIRLTLIRVCRQERQIPFVGDGAKPPGVQFFRQIIVMIAHLLAYVPAPGMDHKPDTPIASPLDFDEVITAAQRTDLYQTPPYIVN